MSELEDVLQQVADALLDHQTRLEALEAAAAPSPRFKKPTQMDVWQYAKVDLNFVELDVDAWFSHYESNGWKIGKAPMKDWKAVVRTWKQKRVENSQPKGYASLQ